jgi:hypothetical protein
MKITYDFKPVLHNRIILYLFTAIALFELIYYLNIKDMYAFSSLILIGLLTSFFNKNMTIILFIAIVFTHILVYGRGSYSEGMENESDGDDSNGNDSDNNDPVDKATAQLSKIKNISNKINKLAATKEDKKNDLLDNIQDIKETRDKIIENVQNMQPLLEKFQGYVDKFQDYKKSQE